MAHSLHTLSLIVTHDGSQVEPALEALRELDPTMNPVFIKKLISAAMDGEPAAAIATDSELSCDLLSFINYPHLMSQLVLLPSSGTAALITAVTALTAVSVAHHSPPPALHLPQG